MKLTLAILAAAATATADVIQVTSLTTRTFARPETNVTRIDFTITDIREGQNGVTTKCSTAWNVGEDSSEYWYPCDDRAFTFNFPQGIADVSEFDLAARHGDFEGEARLSSHVGTAIWGCRTPGGTVGVIEQCGLLSDAKVYLQDYANI
ncbi:hypothetical protein BJY04DRAFT_216504 [Aspergillus karnatakaensis]|uniref:uncharacterized protein n=1 Tax=Aspergillus karnatakaensis TaxID=1810916 RepID=UPI003CCE1E21